MGSFVMGGPPKPKTVVIPGQKYPEACVWQPTSNLLVLFKFFVGYSFLVSRPFTYAKTYERNHIAAAHSAETPNMSSISKNKSLKAALALTEDRTVRKLLIFYFSRGSRERMGITSRG